MAKILNAQSDLRGFNKYPSSVPSRGIPPFMGENRKCFTMAYLAIKYGESYDGFKSTGTRNVVER